MQVAEEAEDADTNLQEAIDHKTENKIGHKQYQKVYHTNNRKVNKSMHGNHIKRTTALQSRQRKYNNQKNLQSATKNVIKRQTMREAQKDNDKMVIEEAKVKMQDGTNNSTEKESSGDNYSSTYESETDEYDALQEFLDAVEPKKRKRRARKKQELTKEEQETKARENLRKRTCEICSMVFSIPKGLQNHMRVKHTFEKPYTCDICDEKFSVQSTYALHRRRHLGIKPHLCNICGKNFLRNTDLQIHMRIHNKVRDVQCNLCANTYNSTMSLKKHTLIKHTDPSEWKHECQICGRKCVSTTTLNLHLKQHNEDRSFKCHICGKGFYTNQNMKVHVRTHSAATKFNCGHCPNGYRSNEALQRHLLKMHGIGEEKLPSLPKHFCPVCRESFLQKARFERHLQLHETGQEEYPFKCEPCLRQYKDKNFFAMHMKNKHNVIIDDDCFKADAGCGLDSAHSYPSLIYKEESNEDADEMF